MPPVKLRALLLPVLITSPLAVASDNPSAHQHGQAQLQLALSGQTVAVYALSPAYNLLGFEHKPRTPEEYQVVDTTIRWLHETPLLNTMASSCTIQASHVRYAFTGEDHHDAEHQHHDEHDEHGKQHHHEGENGSVDKGEQASHTDIEISQTLACPDLEAVSRLTSPLSKRFPALEHLEIAWTGPDGQGSLHLERGESRFQIGR